MKKVQYFVSPFNREEEIKLPKDILIYDTTLRDGEQTPGVCFSKEDKIEIAHKLDELRIHQIEAGFPIVSKREAETVKAIAGEGLNADILGLTRTKRRTSTRLWTAMLMESLHSWVYQTCTSTIRCILQGRKHWKSAWMQSNTEKTMDYM